jgi:hypothetical protein
LVLKWQLETLKHGDPTKNFYFIFQEFGYIVIVPWDGEKVAVIVGESLPNMVLWWLWQVTAMERKGGWKHSVGRCKGPKLEVSEWESPRACSTLCS